MTTRRPGLRRGRSVDLSAIARNYRLLRERVRVGGHPGASRRMRYGHGAVPVARRLARRGRGMFAVAIAEEEGVCAGGRGSERSCC